MTATFLLPAYLLNHCWRWMASNTASQDDMISATQINGVHSPLFLPTLFVHKSKYCISHCEANSHQAVCSLFSQNGSEQSSALGKHILSCDQQLVHCIWDWAQTVATDLQQQIICIWVHGLYSSFAQAQATRYTWPDYMRTTSWSISFFCTSQRNLVHLTDLPIHVMRSWWGWGFGFGLLHAISCISWLLQGQEGAC